MDDVKSDARVVSLLQVLSVLGPALTDEQVQTIIKAVFEALGLEYSKAAPASSLAIVESV